MTPCLRGRKLRWRNHAFLQAEPWCRHCQVRAAEYVDHIVPLCEGGEDVPENLQPLCWRCDRKKTKAEAFVRHEARAQAAQRA